MRILLDTCIWAPALNDIRAAGHDVVWAGSWDRDPGDEEILNRAYADDRILVTLDKDFGELAILRNLRHRGIIRIVGYSVRQHALVCVSILRTHSTELQSGAIVTAQPGRLRISETGP